MGCATFNRIEIAMKFAECLFQVHCPQAFVVRGLCEHWISPRRLAERKIIVNYYCCRHTKVVKIDAVDSGVVDLIAVNKHRFYLISAFASSCLES